MNSIEQEALWYGEYVDHVEGNNKRYKEVLESLEHTPFTGQFWVLPDWIPEVGNRNKRLMSGKGFEYMDLSRESFLIWVGMNKIKKDDNLQEKEGKGE